MMRLVSNYIRQGQQADYYDIDDANSVQADFSEHESSPRLPEQSRALTLPA